MIGAVALIFFGPKRLPELAKGLGKGIRDFKKALEGGDDADKPKLGSSSAAPDAAEPVAGTESRDPQKPPTPKA